MTSKALKALPNKCLLDALKLIAKDDKNPEKI